MGEALRKAVTGWVLLIFMLTLLASGLSRMRGGSAALVLAGQRSDSTEIARLTESTGENRSFIADLALRFKSLLWLDFGKTIRDEQVLPLVLSAFKVTFILSSLAAVLSLFYGITLAIIAQLSKTLRSLLIRLNYAILAVPVFIIALLLLFTLAIATTFFPPGGMQSNNWMWLPAIALASKTGCRLFLFADEFFSREYAKPYVKTFRAFGIPQRRLVAPLILKNIALPVLNYWLIDFSSYLAGAAIVETIFSLPGIGYHLLQSLHQYDLNLLIGILILSSLAVYVVSIAQQSLDFWYRRYSS